MAGLVHICTFILLRMSGERNFGVALNKTLTIKFSVNGIPQVHGNYMDLMIVVFHKLIINGCAPSQASIIAC